MKTEEFHRAVLDALSSVMCAVSENSDSATYDSPTGKTAREAAAANIEKARGLLAETKLSSVQDYLAQVNSALCPGLLASAKEWIVEGWGADVKITPLMLAAAIEKGALTQDDHVRCQDEVDPKYPALLRSIAAKIAVLEGYRLGRESEE